MAFFKTKEPAARLRADLDKLNGHRTDITSQLDEAKASALALTEQYAALIGDASNDEVAKVEGSLSDTERRVAALNARLSVLQRKITETQAELDEHLANEAANRAAADLDRDHAEFAIKLAALVVAAEALLPVATKIGERVTSGKEIEALARAIVAQLPPAARRIEDETRWTCGLIVRERPSRLVKVEHAA